MRNYNVQRRVALHYTLLFLHVHHIPSLHYVTLSTPHTYLTLHVTLSTPHTYLTLHVTLSTPHTFLTLHVTLSTPHTYLTLHVTPSTPHTHLTLHVTLSTPHTLPYITCYSLYTTYLSCSIPQTVYWTHSSRDGGQHKPIQAMVD